MGATIVDGLLDTIAELRSQNAALESKLARLVEALEYWREEEDGKTRASFDDEIDFEEYKLAMADTISALSPEAEDVGKGGGNV